MKKSAPAVTTRHGNDIWTQGSGGTAPKKVAQLIPVPGFPGMMTDSKNPANPKKWGLTKENYTKPPSHGPTQRIKDIK